MRGTFLEIRPRALTDNARRARALANGARVFAMVKANGYGHGLGLAARAFANAVDGLGVAVIEEAQALRVERDAVRQRRVQTIDPRPRL